MRVRLRKLHSGQKLVKESRAIRKILKPGRRWGKTTYAARDASDDFLAGERVLYAAPTQSQTDKFWFEICRAFEEPIQAKKLYIHNTKKILQIPGTETAIIAKTAWNANTLRGDYASKLILDEYQLMNEDTWKIVGAPMLLDNGGRVLFIYTPPSPESQLSSKAVDKMHAIKFRKLNENKPEWEVFYGKSHDNPTLNRRALELIVDDMDPIAYKMEILGQDLEEFPKALWRRSLIRYKRIPLTQFKKIIIAIDPADYTKNSEVGLMVMGLGIDNNIYVIEDASITFAKTEDWVAAAVNKYWSYDASLLVAEKNFGGDMVRHTFKVADSRIRVKVVRASSGKKVRAEPVVKMYRQKRIYHFRPFDGLESQMLFWNPDLKYSPDRLDAMVWGATHLGKPQSVGVMAA